jgi:hypothetical protein
MCVKLYNYLDFRQGSRGHPVRGDQAIADALGCQARTVRTHAEHLAGAGLICIHKFVTEGGAHKATEYEVIHNPGRKRFNENATTPIRKRRARPVSRLVASGTLARSNRKDVARQTRDTSAQEARETQPLPVARSTRDPHGNVGRETRDVLGTQRGNPELYSSLSDELDPDGDVSNISAEALDQAPLTVAPLGAVPGHTWLAPIKPPPWPSPLCTCTQGRWHHYATRGRCDLCGCGRYVRGKGWDTSGEHVDRQALGRAYVTTPYRARELVDAEDRGRAQAVRIHAEVRKWRCDECGGPLIEHKQWFYCSPDCRAASLERERRRRGVEHFENDPKVVQLSCPDCGSWPCRCLFQDGETLSAPWASSEFTS